MAFRIAGINIPVQKHIRIALQAVFGIGQTRADTICTKTKVNPQTKGKDLTEAEIEKLRAAVDGYTVEGDLRREQSMDIKRLMDIASYRGRRHRARLPVRGQNTKSNARTRKRGRKGK